MKPELHAIRPAKDDAAQASDEAPPRFTSIDCVCGGEHDVVTARLDRDCSELSHLIGHAILVDEIAFRCIAAQCSASGPPYKKGQRITLEIVANVA
jgi:hypothetical protein